MPELTHPLAATAFSWARAVAPWAEKAAGAFAQIPLKWERAPVSKHSLEAKPHRTPLTQLNRSRSKLVRVSALTSLSVEDLPFRCKHCGVDLGRRKRVYCDTCLPKQAAIASKKAVEIQGMLRTVGQDKRSSLEVRAKHRDHAVRQNALNAAWEAEQRTIPSPSVFRSDIWPAVRETSIKALKAATGLSVSSCKKIRAGDVVPHPRHWPAISHIASEEHE